MQIDVFEGVQFLEKIREDWEAAYDADPDAQYFMTWTWMSGWLRHLKFPATILAARPEDSAAYVAFLPLWLETIEEKDGGFHNRFNLGGNHFADCTGILCHPEYESEAIPALLRKVKQMNWAHLNLGELRMSDRRFALVTQVFGGKDLKVIVPNSVEDNIDLAICPFARLPAGFDEFLDKQLSANSRQKLRRLLRQLDSGKEFRVTHTDKETFNRDLETLLKFWTARWGERKGKRLEGIVRNYRTMLRLAFDAGQLYMPVLWHGERPVCIFATFMDARKKTCLFFVGGRDQSFDDSSSGLMLHAHSIRHVIAEGYTTYEFLRGNERYKYSFGVEERRLKSLRVSSRDGRNLGGKLDRRSIKFALEKSIEHFRADQDDRAEKGLRQVIDTDPLNEDALYTLGRIVAKRGAHAAAIKLYRKLLAAHPASSKTWFRLAKSLQDRGEHAEAARAYRDGLHHEPGIALPYFYLGQCLAEAALPDLAIAAFDAAVERNPNLPSIAENRAAALVALESVSTSLRGTLDPVADDLRKEIEGLPAIAAALERNKQKSQTTDVVTATAAGVPATANDNDARVLRVIAAEENRSPMKIELIEDTEKLEQLRANWDAVYRADPDAHIFMSWSWMIKWLPWVHIPWIVLAARPEGASEYVAFFPVRTKTKESKNDGLYNEINMGGNHYADYTGIICLPDFDSQAIPALAQEIKRLNWTNMRLEGLRVSEHRCKMLLQEFPAEAFDVVEESRIDDDNIDLSICPFAKLPADWDSYLNQSLSANSRQKLRRLLRQMDADPRLRITHTESGTLDRDIDILLKLWSDRWAERKGDRMPGILKNNRIMLKHMFEAGRLFMPVLWQDERPLGALAIYVDEVKKCYLFFMAGRDQSFEGPSSGLLLHAHSIRHAIANGFITYDFLRGNEPYKYSFGVEEHRIKSLVISTKDRRNLGGRLDLRSIKDAVRRARVHFRADRDEAAERAFRQILESEPGNADVLYTLGRILAKRGDHAAAIGMFRTLLDSEPDTSKAWFRLARSLRAKGELAEAALAYCEGIEREWELPLPYFDLGKTLSKLSLFDLAVVAFDVAAELKPDFPDLMKHQVKALEARSESSTGGKAPNELIAPHVAERVSKLPSIARLLKKAQPPNVPVVLEWQPKKLEPPLPFGHPQLPPGLFAPTKR
jgi:tetratricopeptide (TPR) repeat protein